MTKQSNTLLASYIDHTLLKADATREQVQKLCEEAKQYDFATVCVNSAYVAEAKQFLVGSKVGITTVVGFPLGASLSAVKAFEAKQAILNGATEVDMVINVGWLKDKRLDELEADIREVVLACEAVPVKVIVETCLLTDEEIVVACQLAVKAGAKYVKTSTGFSTNGATVEHIKLMRKTVGEHIGVKASGGIRDTKFAIALIEAGATRLGASASVAIVEGQQIAKEGY